MSSLREGDAELKPLYQEIEPDDCGLLDVGDGHQIYWEVCGELCGKPAVVLHGGPGSGCAPWWRRLFNPEAYRVVLCDQRGCGRSLPHAGAPSSDLAANTTHHLVADIEMLRRHLAIERWLVLGGSWGSTLALAYAQRHPDRVTEMVLFSVGTTTRREVEWVTRDVGRFFPAAWARFRDGVPEPERDGSLVEAYSRLLHDPDPVVRAKAAQDWCDWEDTHGRPASPADLRGSLGRSCMAPRRTSAPVAADVADDSSPLLRRERRTVAMCARASA